MKTGQTRRVRGAAVSVLLLGAGLVPASLWANEVPLGAISLPSPAVLAEDAYMRARLAEADRSLTDAARFYGDVLASDPTGLEAARRGYRHAVLAGDKALAVRAAHLLDQAGQLTRDGTILLLIDALEQRQWPEMLSRTDRLEAEENLAFLAPYLRSWLSVLQKNYAPPEMPTDKRILVFAERYKAEQMLLLALARKDKAGLDEAWAMAESGMGYGFGTEQRALLAAHLSRMGRRDIALDLLRGQGGDGAGISEEEAQARLSHARKLYRKRPVSPRYGMAMLLNRLASDLKGQGDGLVAFSLARMAGFVDPANDDVRVNLAQAGLIAGYPAIAMEEAGRIGAASPVSVEAQMVQARALIAQENHAGAAAMAEAMIARQGQEARGWRLLGDVRAHGDDYAGAAQAYAQARQAQAEREDAALLLQLGAVLEQAGDWEQARPLLERVVELAPDSAMALNHLGYALADRKEDLPRAISLLEKVHRLNPNEAAYIDSLGWAYFRAGNAAKALPLLERAVAMEPDHYELNEHLGDVLWAMGRRFEARHAWKAAVVALDEEDERTPAILERLTQKRDGIWTEQKRDEGNAAGAGKKPPLPTAVPVSAPAPVAPPMPTSAPVPVPVQSAPAPSSPPPGS